MAHPLLFIFNVNKIALTLFLAYLMLGLKAQAQPDIDFQSKCRQVKTILTFTSDRLDRDFKSDFPLHFFDRGSEILSLMEANANRPGGVYFPDPCKMNPRTFPSNEAFLLVLAHEFSHKIFNTSEVRHCRPIFKSRISTMENNPHLHIGSQFMEHVNIDIFGLKLLAHLNVDQRKAMQDFTNHLKQIPKLSGIDEKCCRRQRFELASSRIPTDFTEANDFLPSGYIEDMSLLQNFVDANYPHGRFMTDLRSTFSEEVNGCHFVPEEVLKTEASRTGANIFNSLEISEPGRGEKEESTP